jgi:hypothetical protein
VLAAFGAGEGADESGAGAGLCVGRSGGVSGAADAGSVIATAAARGCRG